MSVKSIFEFNPMASREDGLNIAESIGNDDALGGRLPLLRPQDLDADQHKIYDYLQESKIPWANRAHFQGALADGRLIGPFNVFLYSPQISQLFNDWGDAEAKHTSLPPTVRQVVILTVGAVWNAAYELYAHVAVARSVGLKDEMIASIKAGKEPENLSAQESIAYRFTHTLTTKHGVDDALYRQAVTALGQKGVVDMLFLAGEYMTTCALLNALRIPAPSED